MIRDAGNENRVREWKYTANAPLSEPVGSTF
jgi:hypothetical protein